MGVGAHRGEEAAGLAEHDREALALIAGLGEVAKAAGHAGPEPGPCEAARPCNSLISAIDLMKVVHSIEVPFPGSVAALHVCNQQCHTDKEAVHLT